MQFPVVACPALCSGNSSFQPGAVDDKPFSVYLSALCVRAQWLNFSLVTCFTLHSHVWRDWSNSVFESLKSLLSMPSLILPFYRNVPLEKQWKTYFWSKHYLIWRSFWLAFQIFFFYFFFFNQDISSSFTSCKNKQEKVNASLCLGIFSFFFLPWVSMWMYLAVWGESRLILVQNCSPTDSQAAWTNGSC